MATCKRLALTVVFAALLSSAAPPSWAEPFRILYAEQIDVPVARATAPTAPTAPTVRKPQLATQWALRAYGREYDVVVESNNSLTARLPPAALAGKAVYRGNLRGLAGSWVRLTLVGDEVFGAFWDGTDFYSIAPGRLVAPFLDAPLPASALKATFVYRLSDTQGGIEHSFCGVAGPAGAPGAALGQYRKLVAELQSAAASAALPLQIEVAMLGDFEMQQRFTDPQAQMLATVNVVDGIFTSQVGVAIVPTDLQVFATPDNPFQSTDAATLLNQLSSYRNATPVVRDRGLAHLLTGKSLDSSIAGIAFIGALCEPQSGVGLSEDWLDAGTAALIMAHELGHNFGAPHDGESGSACASVPQNFLMAPVLNFSNTFSSCSLQQMQPHIQAAECIVPLRTADLQVVPPPQIAALVGEPFDIPVEVRSIGELAAQRVELRVGPSFNFTLTGADAAGGTCSGSGADMTCTFDSIASGDSRLVTLHALSTSIGHGSAALRVSATQDLDVDNSEAIVDVEVSSPADIVLSSTPSSIGGPVDTPISFSFGLQAVGPRAARNVTATIFADGTQILSATPSAGSCSIDGGLVSCSFGDLAPGASRRVDVTVQASQVTGQGAAIHVEADNDFNNANDTLGVLLNLQAVRDIAVELPSIGGEFTINSPFDIVVVLRSRGLQESAPGTLTFLFSTASVPIFDSVTGDVGTCTTGTDTVVCSFASIAPGASRTITLRAHGPRGVYEARTIVESGDDDVPGNNEGFFQALVRPEIDVRIDAGDGGGSYFPYVELPFKAHAFVSSIGVATASDVSVRTEIPAQFAVGAVTLQGGSCSVAGQIITCTRASLPRDVHAQLEVELQALQAGSSQADIVVSAPGDTDSSSFGNVARWFFEVREGVDVGIDPAVPVAALLGVPQAVQVVVRNGVLPSASTINLTVPSYVAIESATVAGGRCESVSPANWDCFLDTMDPHAVRRIDLRVRADFMVDFTLAVLAFADRDVNDANNTGSVAVTLTDREGDGFVRASAATVNGDRVQRFNYPTVTVVANTSIDDARVQITLDNTIIGIGAIASDGACSFSGSGANVTMMCLFGTIEAGSQRSVDLELSGSRVASFDSTVTLIARNDTNPANNTTHVAVAISDAPAPPPPPPQQSSGGGGGAIDVCSALVLLLLSGFAIDGRRRSRRKIPEI